MIDHFTERETEEDGSEVRVYVANSGRDVLVAARGASTELTWYRRALPQLSVDTEKIG